MADDRKASNDIEKELSVGNFAKVQARTLGFQLGGMALGAAAGWQLGKTSLKTKVGKWIAKSMEKIQQIKPERAEALAEKGVIPFVGMAVGSIIGTVASMYEHWVKVERELLSVQEINKDVASIMEKRVQFEETIDKQSSIVKELLAKQDSSKSMSDKVRASQETAASAGRGAS